MVTNITSLTGNGLKDWLIQRISSIYLLGYFIFLFSFLLAHPNLNYTDWHLLFHDWKFKIATLLALFFLSLHAWIGIWTVTTDYIKPTGLRLFIQMMVLLGLLSQFIWGLMMMWGQ